MYRSIWQYITHIIFLLTILLIFSACSQSNTPYIKPMNPPNDRETQITESLHTVKIGFIGPIAGSAASEGTAARNAFLMAIEEANQSGRFPYTIEAVIINDMSDVKAATVGAKRLVLDPQLVAVTGFWNSGPAAAAIPIFIEAEVPLLIWGAIREDLTNEYHTPWITRSVPTNMQENIPLAQVIIDDMDYRRWFVVSDESSHGMGNYDAFIKELSLRNITPAGTALLPEEEWDVSQVVRSIIATRARAVYCGSTHTIAAEIKRGLYEAGVTDIIFCGNSGMNFQDFFIIGNPAAEGTLVVNPGIILEETAIGRRFIERYNANGFEEPIAVYTPFAYEATLILLNALSVCSATPTSIEMANAIFRSSTTGIMGTTSFNEIGQTHNIAAYLSVAQDGVWVPLQNSEYAEGLRLFGGGKH